MKGLQLNKSAVTINDNRIFDFSTSNGQNVLPNGKLFFNSGNDLNAYFEVNQSKKQDRINNTENFKCIALIIYTRDFIFCH